MTASYKKTSSHMRALKRVAVLMLAPLALLLSACHADADITVTAAGGVYINVDIIGGDDSADMDCNSYGVSFSDFPGDVNVTDFTGDLDTDVSCNVSAATDNGMDGHLLIDNDSTYILNIPIDDILEDADVDDSATYNLTVHMPGDIVSASGEGKIDGAKVVYEGKISELSGDIAVEANKSSGSSFAVWITGVLILMLGAALVISRFLRAKHPQHAANEASASSLGIKGAKSGRDSDKAGDSTDNCANDSPSVSASTSDSTVALAPLPDKYSGKNIDGISISESYSEKIDMVDPVVQGRGADVVKRENVVLAFPSETAEVAPIPGMPPRISFDSDVMVSNTSASNKNSDSDESAELSSQSLDNADDDDVDDETGV